MMAFTQKLGAKALLRIAALGAAGLAVSGCTYDMGLGYASDGYGSGYYDCDPYSPFDSYYDCDNGYGFSNIGYGGGWYDNYWYPGYGFYLFDNYGQRYNMRDNHRRYWGERRHSWYRENRGRHDGGGRRDGRGYTDGGRGMDQIGWPERNGGRVRDGDRSDRNRGGDRRDRGRGWQGGEGNGANAIPTPTPEAASGESSGRGRGEGRRNRGGYRPAWGGNDGAGAVQTPRANRPEGRSEERQERGRQLYRPTAPENSSQSVPQSAAPAPRQQRAPQAENSRRSAPPAWKTRESQEQSPD